MDKIEKKVFYDVKDIVVLTGCKKTAAYNVINVINKKLMAEGYSTFRGKVLAKAFNREYGIS